MDKLMKPRLTLLSTVLLCGCTTSGFVQTGPDSFMARAHSTLFTIDPGGAGAIANATEIGAKHCTDLGKYIVVNNTQISRIGAGAQAIVNFECVDKSDKDYVRPKIQPMSPDGSPAIIINNQIN
jgi:hypothetical protein